MRQAIADRYGKDRTFSVPILTMLSLAGRLGADPWRLVPQLPFELAACPHRWFQWLRLPVGSKHHPRSAGGCTLYIKRSGLPYLR